LCYIGRSGEILIEPQFGGCESFSDGVARIIYEGKFHYIDKWGNIIITTPYEMAWDFRDGLAFVQSGDDISEAKYGYIDKTGKVVWQPSK
jgi:WG containing repeat